MAISNKVQTLETLRWRRWKRIVRVKTFDGYETRRASVVDTGEYDVTRSEVDDEKRWLESVDLPAVGRTVTVTV